MNQELVGETDYDFNGVQLTSTRNDNSSVLCRRRLERSPDLFHGDEEKIKADSSV